MRYNRNQSRFPDRRVIRADSVMRFIIAFTTRTNDTGAAAISIVIVRAATIEPQRSRMIPVKVTYTSSGFLRGYRSYRTPPGDPELCNFETKSNTFQWSTNRIDKTRNILCSMSKTTKLAGSPSLFALKATPTFELAVLVD